MADDKPTKSQLSYLKSLGVRQKPKTKDEASSLIDAALQTAPPEKYQLEYLQQLHHTEPVSSFAQARKFIRKYENPVHDQLGEIYPLYAYRVIPYSIVRKIVVTLRNSHLWDRIASAQKIKTTEYEEVLAPALGSDVFKILNTKGEATAGRLEEKASNSQQYIEGYLSAHGWSIQEQELREIAFDAIVNGLAGKMSSALQSTDDEDEMYEKDNKLNQSLKALLKEHHINIGTGCLLLVLFSSGIATATAIALRIIT